MLQSMTMLDRPQASHSLSPEIFSGVDASPSSIGQKSVSVGLIIRVVLFRVKARGFMQGGTKTLSSQPWLLVELSSSKPLLGAAAGTAIGVPVKPLTDDPNTAPSVICMTQG